MSDLPDDLRVTHRLPVPVAFALRLLLVLAVVGLVAFGLWVGFAVDGAYIRARAGR